MTLLKEAYVRQAGYSNDNESGGVLTLVV